MEEIPYRLPLVIGATGHRDLRDDDISALEGAVAAAIKRLKREYLHDDPETPVIVLSSLAEGADRLIARVAMDLGAKLIAPLPMEPEEYRHDFMPGLKPDAAAEFDRLKSKALAAPVMRLAEGNTRENLREESRRALQYREVGLFIVRHCHVLIALWDGDASSTSIGGTAEVVRFKREGVPLEVTESAQASLDAPEIGPVIHVVTPRTKAGNRTTGVASPPWGDDIDGPSPQGEGPEEQAEAWENLEVQAALTRGFNGEAAALERDSARAAKLDQSADYLFGDPERDKQKRISGEPAKQVAMRLVPHWFRLYQLADVLAQEWQARFKRDWIMLFGLGFAALLSFEVLTHVVFDEENLYWLLLLYVLIFAGVFGWFGFARRRRHQERFLDYRAFAEALRVAVFWKLAGIGWPAPAGAAEAQTIVDLSSGDSVAKAYPIRQPRELDWVKTCLRTLELLDADKSPEKVGHNIETDGHAWARAFWVHGQLDFFSRRGPAHEHRAAKLLLGSGLLAGLSVVLALLLFLSDSHSLGSRLFWEHVQYPHRFVIFFIGLLPGFAAVFAGYAERLALEAQARQYDRMRALFARAHDILQSHPPVAFRHIQALYGELGAEAMKENAEWVAIYRQRPIRPP